MARAMEIIILTRFVGLGAVVVVANLSAAAGTAHVGKVRVHQAKGSGEATIQECRRSVIVTFSLTSGGMRP